jgi:hypothetical protein
MKQSDNEEEMAKINKDKLHFLFRIYDDDGLSISASDFSEISILVFMITGAFFLLADNK